MSVGKCTVGGSVECAGGLSFPLVTDDGSLCQRSPCAPCINVRLQVLRHAVPCHPPLRPHQTCPPLHHSFATTTPAFPVLFGPIPCPPPSLAPDSNLLHHLGPISTFFTFSAAQDFWFKTNVRTDMMSLMHITDTTRKHACLCVEFNTDAQFNFDKGSILFYMRDARGDVLSATLKADIFDDAWHNVIWKIVNAANNQVSIWGMGRRRGVK